MCTGLVAAKGEVVAVDEEAEGVRLTLAAETLAPQLSVGDSVAVSGVCLSATVMAETLRRSSLGPLAAGDEVNLELPLRAGDRLGGHIVQGHVDGVGEV